MPENTIEITRNDWETRKLTDYGKLSRHLDTLLIGVAFSVSFFLILLILQGNLDQMTMRLYAGMAAFFVVFSFKTLDKISTPLSSYQTIIIKK